jgi:hypothetical protein
MKQEIATGARRGEQALKRLREQPPAIWYRGELVKDVTTHPPLRGSVHTLATLYDMQWKQPDVSLYDSPTSGNKVARSFMMPKTREELERGSDRPGRYPGQEPHERLIRNVDPICGGLGRPLQVFYLLPRFRPPNCVLPESL